MANYRQIHVKMWKQDGWFLDLGPMEKLLFIYCFSNECASIAGIYELPRRVIEFETGLSSEFVTKTLQDFERDGKVYYQDGVIWVKNLRKYNENTSPKVLTRIENDIASIPDCELKRQYIQYHNGIDTVSIPEPETGSEHEQEHEQEQEQEEHVAPLAQAADAPPAPTALPPEPDPPKKRTRAPTELDKLKTALVAHFCEVTQIPPPLLNTKKQCAAAGRLWFKPLVAIADAVDRDAERAKSLIAFTIKHMDGEGLTISTPASIQKTAISEQAKRKRGAVIKPNGGSRASPLDASIAAVRSVIDQEQAKGYAGGHT